MGTCQDRDGLTQFTIGGQPPVQVRIHSKDIGQGHSVGVIGLRPCH